MDSKADLVVLADFVAYYFLTSAEEKQKHLEILCRETRVNKIIAFVEKRIDEIQKVPLASLRELSSLVLH